MATNIKNIRGFSDGEQATAAILNRPIEDLEKQTKYMSEAQFKSNQEINRNNFSSSPQVKPSQV